MLHDLVRRGAWDRAVRLCRFVSDPSIWATLAAMAMVRSGQRFVVTLIIFA